MPDDIEQSEVILVAVFLLLSAFFSGSEAALLSIQRIRLHQRVTSGSNSARRVAKLIESPEKLLPPILLGNNLANTGAAAVGTAIAIGVFDTERTGILVATITVTVLLLIFGETIPKTISAAHAERVAFTVSIPVLVIQWLLKPVSILLEGLSKIATRPFGASRRDVVTASEIKVMAALATQVGTVEWNAADMIRRVLNFGARRAREVMTPRAEVISVHERTSFGEFLKVYARYPHTRFPVLGNDDEVQGYTWVKDLLRAQAAGYLTPDVPVSRVMRSPLYVAETKLVQELFDEMRADGKQLSIVIDEFGGLAGIVTLKQLMEEIVGAVGEEGEAPEAEVLAISEGSFELDAGMLVKDANEQLLLNLPEGDYDTVAGFILDRLGHMPQEAEELTHGNLHLRILEMKGMRIDRILVTRTGRAPE